MAIVAHIPIPLQKFTRQQRAVQTTATTIQDMLNDPGRLFPGLREQLCDERGVVRKFVNLYLNHEDIRFLQGEKTLLQDGDEVAIIPAVVEGGGKQKVGVALGRMVLLTVQMAMYQRLRGCCLVLTARPRT